MNKKQSLVATAWMLGGGLLLNASLVEAQVASPADEYYAPQRSAPAPAKKAPALLPDVIRNADGTNGSTVRPIAPQNNSLDAGRKMNGMAPKATRPGNRVSVMPANHQNEAVVQPANQSDAPPSPIQKQLEELYRKDGRPMPQMNFNQTPISPNGQAPNVNNRPVVAPSNVVPPKPRGLLDRINPFSRAKSAPAPLPQHPASPIPNTAVRPPQIQPGGAVGLNGIKPAANSNNFNNAAAPKAAVAPAAQPSVVAASPVAAQPAQNGSQLSNALPPVPGDPGYPAPLAPAVEAAANVPAVPIPPAPASVDEALENAFNDLAEEPADKPSKPVETKPAENDNPFSGLSLDDEFGPAPGAAKPASAKPEVIPSESAQPKSVKDADPVSADLKGEVAAPEIPSEGKKEISPEDIPLPEDAAPAESKKLEGSSAEPPKTEVDIKMKLIAERGELRGLKGFCPVALRDDRDLKNALPEHHSTHKGRTYYFSTAEAKVAFDEHPQHYAPISGGQDVVLLKEKLTKEGSLDHAVWFKDRLYLFTSQKTLEQFVATPTEFAISE